MPELPEVETVRRTVERRAGGRRILAVTDHTAGRGYARPVLHVAADAPGLAGLAGERLTGLRRHGKQLALLTRSGVLRVQLGMSGKLLHLDHERPDPPHTHLSLALEGGSRLVFSDPRRFGGVRLLRDQTALQALWDRLGPDALEIGPAALYGRLSGTTRALKAALLDQDLVAGLGNIYVDELLHTRRLAPQRPAHTVSRALAEGLVRSMRTLLNQAVRVGGSTVRDYADANGRAGGFQDRHRVYGRAGLPCLRCRHPLHSGVVSGRTTVWCGACVQGG